MGEESDGQYMLPEDYAALYLQFATALHKVDPNLKLGGPSFEGVNDDIEVWPDADGRTSWTRALPRSISGSTIACRTCVLLLRALSLRALPHSPGPASTMNRSSEPSSS